jgi:hypothetical protein
MFAGKFQPHARFFDPLEVRLRKLGQWIVVGCRDAQAKSGA